MAETYKQILVNGLKHYHDCSFTPGVYGHSIIGQAALLLEKSEEVVPCKDCKHYKPQEKSAKWHGSVNYCTRSASLKMPPDGFCSYGERREGE